MEMNLARFREYAKKRGFDLAYLRLDFVVSKNESNEIKLYIMEVEGIEPYKYFYERSAKYKSGKDYTDVYANVLLEKH